MEKRFIKDYDLHYGEPVYIGKEYLVEVPPAVKKKAAAFAMAKAALFVGMFLTGDHPARFIPVGVPFALLIIFIPLFCYNVPRFMRLPYPMERRHYEGAFTHMGIYAGVSVLLCAACGIGFFIWAAGAENIRVYEFLFPVFTAGIAVLSALFFKDWIAAQKKAERK